MLEVLCGGSTYSPAGKTGYCTYVEFDYLFALKGDHAFDLGRTHRCSAIPDALNDFDLAISAFDESRAQIAAYGVKDGMHTHFYPMAERFQSCIAVVSYKLDDCVRIIAYDCRVETTDDITYSLCLWTSLQNVRFACVISRMRFAVSSNVRRYTPTCLRLTCIRDRLGRLFTLMALIAVHMELAGSYMPAERRYQKIVLSFHPSCIILKTIFRYRPAQIATLRRFGSARASTSSSDISTYRVTAPGDRCISPEIPDFVISPACAFRTARTRSASAFASLHAP